VTEVTAPAEVAHQFDDPDQQRDAANFGMWVFLVTEVMFFGGLFAGYTVYRSMYPEAFAFGSQFMDVPIGATNTTVLICSSLTMALAVRSAQLSQRKALIWFLIGTIFFGLVFLGVKAYEYHHKYVEHLIPGLDFNLSEQSPQMLPWARQIQMLFIFYFVMTGMHALHMVIGVGLLTYLIIEARKGRFHSGYYTPVDNIGLYWHFVDIVWIFLFPMLYLIGQHLRHHT
jgi:cytochrome c oxidase subunit 3